MTCSLSLAELREVCPIYPRDQVSVNHGRSDRFLSQQKTNQANSFALKTFIFTYRRLGYNWFPKFHQGYHRLSLMSWDMRIPLPGYLFVLHFWLSLEFALIRIAREIQVVVAPYQSKRTLSHPKRTSSAFSHQCRNSQILRSLGDLRWHTDKQTTAEFGRYARSSTGIPQKPIDVGYRYYSLGTRTPPESTLLCIRKDQKRIFFPLLKTKIRTHF